MTFPTRLFLVAALCGAACGLAGPRASAEEDGAPATGVSGDTASGTVELSVPTLLRCLDPPRAEHEGERIVVLNLYDQLYEYHHLARPFEIQPCLAAALPEVSPDGRVLTIRLNPQARFIDDPCFVGGKGRPVTAADVAFCLLRLMDRNVTNAGTWVLEHRVQGLDAFREASAARPKNPRRTNYSTEQGYPAVPGIQAVDDHTLRLRLTRACPELPWLLATSFASIYPPEAVARYGDAFARHPVTSGPYVVKSFISDQRIILGANAAYRGATYPMRGDPADEDRGNLVDAGRPLPRNGMVVVRAHPDGNQEWNALLAGTLDCGRMSRDAALSSLDPSTRSELIPALQARSLRLERTPRMEMHYYVFNMADKVLGHPAGEKGAAIRRAISLARDETWTLTRLLGGLAERVYGPVLPECNEFERTWTNEWLLQPGEDREEALGLARELLEEAGHPGGKGIPTIKAHCMPYDGSRQEFAEFQRQVSEIGIRIEPVEMQWADMLTALKKGAFQLMPSTWMADYPDALNFLMLFYGPYAPDLNFSGFNDPDYNEPFERALRLPVDHEDRESLIHRMRNHAADHCPWIYRYRRIHYSVVHPWVRGYRYNDLSPKYFQYLWIDDDARRKALRK